MYENLTSFISIQSNEDLNRQKVTGTNEIIRCFILLVWIAVEGDLLEIGGKVEEEVEKFLL